MRRRIKGAARAIKAIWRTTVLHFPIVGKYRTVAGFALLFLSDTLSLNKRTVSASCCHPRVLQPWPWARGRDGGSLQQLAC